MSASSRRFEILLPLRFNDGQAVPDAMTVEVLLELEKQFGAVSSETQVIRGFWQSEESPIATIWCAFSSMSPTPKRIANSSWPSRIASRRCSDSWRFGSPRILSMCCDRQPLIFPPAARVL